MRFLVVVVAVVLLVAIMLFVVGCMPASYADQYTQGIPNLHNFAPGMWRTGLPPDQASWNALRAIVEEPNRRVTKVVLHDDAEGDESPAYAFGWNVIKVPLTPEDDKPLTVFVKPKKSDVDKAVNAILDAHARGDVVVWGCVHDRDRGGMISALVGMRLFGWTKDYAWKYAISTGLRWELPDLDAYWIDDVQK